MVCLLSDPAGDRTLDPVIKSHLLYRLSYEVRQDAIISILFLCQLKHFVFLSFYLVKTACKFVAALHTKKYAYLIKGIKPIKYIA